MQHKPNIDRRLSEIVSFHIRKSEGRYLTFRTSEIEEVRVQEIDGYIL